METCRRKPVQHASHRLHCLTADESCPRLHFLQVLMYLDGDLPEEAIQQEMRLAVSMFTYLVPFECVRDVTCYVKSGALG